MVAAAAVEQEKEVKEGGTPKDKCAAWHAGASVDGHFSQSLYLKPRPTRKGCTTKIPQTNADKRRWEAANPRPG